MPDCLQVMNEQNFFLFLFFIFFFPQRRNQDGLQHARSLENPVEVFVTSTLIPDELIRINVSVSNTSGYHND